MTLTTLFNKTEPYGAFGAVGVTTGILFLYVICRRRDTSFNDSLYVYIWACILSMIGAKALYVFINIRSIISYLMSSSDGFSLKIQSVLSGGFVFYGGLFGAFLGVYIASKYFKLNNKEQMDICIPILPIVHGFGRIGCYCVGCCYGIPYSGPFAIRYVASNYAPNEIGLFPTQIIESVYNFTIFLFLFICSIKQKKLNYTRLYLLSYATFRFFIEFARGDEYRGFLGFFSISQWISIGIVLIELIGLAKKHNNTYNNNDTNGEVQILK